MIKLSIIFIEKKNKRFEKQWQVRGGFCRKNNPIFYSGNITFSFVKQRKTLVKKKSLCW